MLFQNRLPTWSMALNISDNQLIVLGGYFAVRPVRETIGTVLGREATQNLWFFTALFAIGRMPGWLAQWEEIKRAEKVKVRAGDIEFEALVRIDTPSEAHYYRHGGIMQYVLRGLLKA